MGRPRGSKNKPKVTTALVGEVISKPLTPLAGKLRKEVEQIKTELDSKRDAIGVAVVDFPSEEPTNGDKMVSEGSQVLSDEDINSAALKEAQQTVTKRRKLSVKDKNVEDRFEFIFKELKSLREYVYRLETLLNVTRNEETNEPEPVHKRRRKSLTLTEHHDKLDPVEIKETVHEKEQTDPAGCL